MNTEWNQFLTSQGASVENDLPVFPDAPADAACALCDLTGFGLISVNGDDAETFLQGQLTNDVCELTDTHSQMAGLCNPKGRMLANFLNFRLRDGIYLQIPRTHLPPILKRLTMYVLRSKVTLADASDDLVQIGLMGDCANELLSESVGAVPAEAWDSVTTDGLTLIKLPGSAPRVLVVGDAGAVSAVWPKLTAKAAVVKPQAWHRQNILAGLPVIFPETSEAFVPQMANMQLVNGVSFTKGCYTGQEVVARMQYLGKLKRRMYLAHVDADSAPARGAELFAESSTSGQGAGKIVDVAANPDGGFDLLAVMEVDSYQSGKVHAGENGPILDFKPLPYAFPADDEK